MINAQIIQALERFAPLSLQEKWDNSGVQVGYLEATCSGALICLDVTPGVLDEAMHHKCNLIISHHPLLFHGVKRLIGADPQQHCIMRAITEGITIYSSHTAIDSARGGVSYHLAELMGVTPLRVLDSQADRLVKLQVTVPRSHAEIVRLALYDAGAGKLGDYDCCSFSVTGEGTFRAKEGAHPHVGEIGIDHLEEETEISVVLERTLMGKVEKALLEVHPYETPAYQLLPMLNKVSTEGIGIYGTLERPLSPEDFIDRVKEATGAKTVRCTQLPVSDSKISRVALCGGAGHEYIGTALAMGAQAYVTGDIKYHDFVDYQHRLLLVDAGHYETEAHIKQVMHDTLKAACPTLRIVMSERDANPVYYV